VSEPGKARGQHEQSKPKAIQHLASGSAPGGISQRRDSIRANQAQAGGYPQDVLYVFAADQHRKRTRKASIQGQAKPAAGIMP